MNDEPNPLIEAIEAMSPEDDAFYRKLLEKDAELAREWAEEFLPVPQGPIGNVYVGHKAAMTREAAMAWATSLPPLETSVLAWSNAHLGRAEAQRLRRQAERAALKVRREKKAAFRRLRARAR